MLTQPNVTRISISIDDLGMFLHQVENLNATTKRERKSKFRRGERVLRALEIIEPKQVLHSIASGLTAAGDLVVELTVSEKSNA